MIFSKKRKKKAEIDQIQKKKETNKMDWGAPGRNLQKKFLIHFSFDKECTKKGFPIFFIGCFEIWIIKKNGGF